MEEISTNTTLGDSHGVVLVDTTLGTVTLSLPDVADFDEKRYTIKLYKGSNAVTITTTDIGGIDGNSFITLPTLYDVVSLISCEDGWCII